MTGHLSEAVVPYRRAIGIWRKLLGPEHPSVAVVLLNLGQLYLALGDLEEAYIHTKQAAEAFSQDVDFDDADALRACNDVCRSLRVAGQKERCDRLERIVAQLSERVGVVAEVRR